MTPLIPGAGPPPTSKANLLLLNSWIMPVLLPHHQAAGETPRTRLFHNATAGRLLKDSLFTAWTACRCSFSHKEMLLVRRQSVRRGRLENRARRHNEDRNGQTVKHGGNGTSQGKVGEKAMAMCAENQEVQVLLIGDPHEF